jgi:hypothetical protein
MASPDRQSTTCARHTLEALVEQHPAVIALCDLPGQPEQSVRLRGSAHGQPPGAPAGRPQRPSLARLLLVGFASSLTLADSCVTANAGNGAIALIGRELAVASSRVDGNTGSRIVIFQDTATLRNSLVDGNTIGRNGGGVRVERGELPSVLNVVNSTVSDNSADQHRAHLPLTHR